MSYQPEELEKAHSHCLDNEIEILSSSVCGCFFCRSHFSAREVNDWDNSAGHSQALCPECGMPAVIGDASGLPVEDKVFLKEMNLAYFGPDYIATHPEAAQVYLDRYFGGKITHNQKNEKLAVTYLQTLADNGDEKAMITLASYYQDGGHFGRKNTSKAIKILSSPALKCNPEALVNLGTLYFSMPASPETDAQAYECYAKASALGSMEGAFFFAQCYLFGVACSKDPEFGLNLLLTNFIDVYEGFLSGQESINVFINYCYRIAICFQDGVGAEINLDRALRFLLMASFALSKESDTLSERNKEISEEIFRRISVIAKEKNYKKGDYVLDQFTFYDTLIDASDALRPIRLVHSEFDPSSHELDMELEFSAPMLFVDIGSLTCGVLNGTTHWRFTGISAFQGHDGETFTRIFTPLDGTWVFVKESNLDPVMIITFQNEEDEEEGEE